MKSFSVAIVVASMSLCGLFIQTVADVRNCYECKEGELSDCIIRQSGWTSKACTTKCYEVSIQDKNNEAVGVLRGCAASKNDINCVGALASESTNKLIKDSCKYCSTEDKCNKTPYTVLVSSYTGNGTNATDSGNGTKTTNSGNSYQRFTGFVVQCAFISSLVVAKMFFQTV
ncbi:hypothetical protein QTP88_000341 [Uroleucon formosanum]